MTHEEMLDLSWFHYDLCEEGEEITVRQYLQELLIRLFDEGEGFSGKRPFGNSGWEDDLAFPLVKGGALKGKVATEGEDEDAYEYVEDFDNKAYAKLVNKLILAL